MSVVLYQDKINYFPHFTGHFAEPFSMFSQVGDNREWFMGQTILLGTESTILYYLQTWTLESELIYMLAQPPVVQFNFEPHFPYL